MLIQCPNCNAKFSLPNTFARHNATLRCSLCKHVFPIEEGLLSDTGEAMTAEECATYLESIVHTTLLTENDATEQSAQQNPTIAPQHKKGITKSLFIVLLFLGLLAGIFYLFYTSEQKNPSQPTTSQTESVEKLAIQDLRQYYISNNNKTKPFFVIEGKIQNNDNETKAFITLKATLLDKKGVVVAEKEQLAGVILSSFQLQSLTKEELEATLADSATIATSNSAVLPKKTVPFTLLFFDPPKNVVEFTVQVISATTPRQ